MLRSVLCKSVMLTVALVLLTSRGVGQEATIDSSFPFGSSQAVAVDPVEGLVFMGAGAGILVLAFDEVTGQILDPPLAELRLEGFCQEIVLTDDHVYVAAGRNDIVRFDRPDYTNRVEFDLDDVELTDVWALDVFSIQGTDYVLAGTNDGSSSGRLFLVEFPQGSSPSTVHDIAAPAPVYAIEADGQAGNVMVLVGTSCATGDGSLLRYDFPTNAAPLAIPALSDSWSIEGAGGPEPTFVRDIVIDENGEYAYVAVFTRGIWKCRVDAPGTILTASLVGAFPIEPVKFVRYDGLALQQAGGLELLLVAQGPPIQMEHQIWGCADAEACDDPEAGSSSMGDEEGIRLYRTDTAAEMGFITFGSRDCAEDRDFMLEKGPPLKLAAMGAGNTFHVFAATETRGLQAFRATTPNPCPEESWPFGLERTDEVDLRENPAFRDDILSRVDDVVQVGDIAYVSTEGGLAAFDVSLGPAHPDFLLEPLMPWVHGNGNAVLIDVIEIEGAVPPTHLIVGRGAQLGLYKATELGGVWSLTYEGGVDIDLDSDPLTDSKGFSVRLIDGERTPGNDPTRPWVFVTNFREESTLGGTGLHGSVVVYEVDVTTSETELIGVYAPDTRDGGLAQNDGYWMDSHVVGSLQNPHGGSLTVLTTYAPGNDLELDAGLMVLEATWNENAPQCPLEFAFQGKFPAILEPGVPDLRAGGRITVANDVAYTAFACNGVAAFDVSSPLTPSVLGSWPADATDLSGLHAVAGSDGKMYVTFINRDIGGVGVFDVADVAAGPEVIQPTTFNANALFPTAPQTPGAPAFFVADGGGGLLFMEFPAPP